MISYLNVSFAIEGLRREAEKTETPVCFSTLLQWIIQK